MMDRPSGGPTPDGDRRGRMGSCWTEVLGSPIHARVSLDPFGRRPAVVLVHGAGVSSRYLMPTAELLARTSASTRRICPGSARAPSRATSWMCPSWRRRWSCGWTPLGWSGRPSWRIPSVARSWPSWRSTGPSESTGPSLSAPRSIRPPAPSVSSSFAGSATRLPTTTIRPMLFSHGVDSIGLAPIERWRALLQRARQLSGFVGVDERAFPRDFATFVRYSTDLKKLP